MQIKCVVYAHTPHPPPHPDMGRQPSSINCLFVHCFIRSLPLSVVYLLVFCFTFNKGGPYIKASLGFRKRTVKHVLLCVLLQKTATFKVGGANSGSMTLQTDLEERHGMQWLFPHTHQVTPHACTGYNGKVNRNTQHFTSIF